MVRYTKVEVEYDDYDTDLIGVAKDGGVNDNNPTWNYGASGSVLIDDFTNEYIYLAELKMPEKQDIVGADVLFKVEFGLYVATAGISTPTGFNIYSLTDEDALWLEGTQNGAVGYCHWQKKDAAANDWTNFADHSKLYSGDENIIHGLSGGSIGFVWFNMTNVLDWGDRKSFFIRNMIQLANKWLGVSTRDHGTAAQHPIIKITYLSYPPEGFEGDGDGLKIEPNEDDRTQPKLTWGGVKADDFTQYKLYRDTSPITSVDGFKSAITVAAIATDKFTIAGEHGDAFPVGSTFKVTGSTGNDGRWTVKSVVESGTTVIETDEDITDATADGHIHHGIWTSIDPAIAEFIDTFAHVDNSTYYYKLIAEDQDNHEDDALLSAPVNFTKPDVTTITLSDTGVQNVGILETITVVSPQNIKKVFIDWDDELGEDGDVETWKEYESVGTTKTDTHIYSQTFNGVFTGVVNSGGGVIAITAANHNIETGMDVRILNSTHYNGTYVATYLNVNVFKVTAAYVATDSGDYRGLHSPSGRVQDEKGFWSSLTAVSIPVELIDTSPTAKLRIDIKKQTLGDDITLDGSLSQPAASNITITKYEFKRDAADAWQDNGTDPVYTFDSGTYPNSVGSKTASLQITTGSGETDTDTATYELETGTPTVLSFSKDTKIHELNHILSQNKATDIPVGSAGTEHEFLISRRAERINLVGTSNHPNTGDDIELIRSAWTNNTYVRITVTTEMEDHDVQYDCKIDGDISLGQSYDNKQSWTFPIRVLARTDIRTSGKITAFSYVGAGTTRVTSATHGLVLTDSALITGSVNYNGTYPVTNPLTNTFDIAHPYKVAITGVNQGTKTFTIAGNYAHLFGTNKKFVISGSTGNNGTHQVSTSSNVGGNTEIIIVGSIPDATVDGYIEFGNDGLGQWEKVE